MKNSPYLDKPLRSEREARMEALLRQIMADWPQAFIDDDDAPDEDRYMDGGDAVEALLTYIYEAKEILKP